MTSLTNQSNDPRDYQEGLVAVLPDQTGLLPDPEYVSIAVANTDQGFIPAGELAHDDMFGNQQFCSP